MAEYAYLSTPDPEIAEDLRVMSENQDGPMDHAVVREYANVMAASLKKALESELPSESSYDVKDFMFDTGDGSGAKVLARNIVPTKSTPDEKFPLFFWIHGGGWIAGDVNVDDSFLRIICANLRISVVNCEYRLSPEHVFPTALNDCYTVLKYVAGNPDQFSASLEKGFIIGGASSGGNLSAALALRLRDDPFFKEKPLTGQLLMMPLVIHPDAHSELPEEYRSQLLSMEQNKDAPGLNKEAVYRAVTTYQGPPKDPYMSPLLADSHKGLPPAFIQVAGLDPLRDEAFVYEKILNKNGVSTKLVAYPGVPHSGPYLFTTKEVGKKWRKDWQDGLQWLLGFSSKN
ncbi:hypothetical protein K435DRAFT_717541 [Dendrothele bispora CBS 962.96]|uniref:Alpha/beta hydrolase fold-3 domain-containing protein n=1 Tax=Dendrothele bispora (strain CBS 962.96) TaxID=1314807 RepID=A0A4S8MIL0_DENBC|nr:hypothetical protein K435DRAFT_717541 [Dendrothele bispora CBS 962.96]